MNCLPFFFAIDRFKIQNKSTFVKIKDYKRRIKINNKEALNSCRVISNFLRISHNFNNVFETTMVVELLQTFLE